MEVFPYVMKIRNWDKIEPILDKALQLSPDERANYLKEACTDDDSLLNKISGILEIIEEAKENGFLDDKGSGPIVSVENFQASTEAHHHDRIGKTIGPYEITELLGTGGMSIVYKASRKDGHFSQTVAIKFLQKKILSKETIKRFRKEQRIQAGLNHPHIAQLYDGGITSEGTPYFIMEYIDGIPIDEYCNDKKLTIDKRLEIFKDVCKAVQYAHSNLVVHRDLKAQNILVTNDGIVKVLDFGIAKLIDSRMGEQKLQETVPGQKFWTPQYAAPEQIRGEFITTATDVYALGVLLHKIFTDQFPLSLANKRLIEVEREICFEEPTKPSKALSLNLNPTLVCENRGASCKELRKKLKGDLDAIVTKALRKDPKYRYTSAGHLIDDLNNYKGNLPLIASTDSASYRILKFIKRNKRKLGTASLFLITILTFGSYHIQKINEQKRLAEVEANKAKQVSTFMINLFDSGKSNDNVMDTLNVYDLLERGKEQITDIAAQPNVQISLILSIANSYQKIGEYNEAVKLLDKADSLSSIIYKTKNIQDANIASQLGHLHQELKNFEISVNYFSQAVNIFNELSNNYWRAHAKSLHGLANSLLKAEKPYPAEITIKKAINLKVENDATKKSILESRLSLAKIYTKMKYYQRAEPLYIEILKGIATHDKSNKSLKGETLFSLGKMLHEQKRYKEAFTFYNAALKIFDDIYDESHPKIKSARSNLDKVNNIIEMLMARS